MRTELEELEYIQSYLDNSLSESETLAFETKLQEDSSFYDKVEKQKAINHLIIDRELIKLNDQVKNYDYSKIQLNDNKSSSKKYIFGIIGFSILIGAGLFIYKESKSDKVATNTSIIDTTELPTQTRAQEPQTSFSKPKTKSHKPNKKQFKETVKTSITTQKEAITENYNKKLLTVTLPKTKNLKQEEESKNTVNCNNTIITANIAPVNTCKGLNEGAINIFNPKGGLEPYQYSIDKTNYTKASTINNLGTGTYNIFLKDKNGCISKPLTTSVNSYSCKDVSENSFAPENGEVFTLPINDDYNGTLEIKDNNGNLIFKEEIIYGSPNSWDAYSNEGLVPKGIYFFTLTEENTLKTQEGSVSVIK